jgi:hypothetical protein
MQRGKTELLGLLGKTCVLDGFHLSPSRRNIWLREIWMVNEVQVDVFNAKLSRAAVRKPYPNQIIGGSG